MNDETDIFDIQVYTSGFENRDVSIRGTGTFDNPEIDSYIINCQKILDNISTYVENHLSGKATTSKSQGGFYSMVTFNTAHKSSKTLCSHLINETGIALLPGYVFGMKEQQIKVETAIKV